MPPVIQHVDAKGARHFYKKVKNGGHTEFMCATVDQENPCINWQPVALPTLPLGVVSELFDCATEQLKLVAYSAYRIVVKWDQLSPTHRAMYEAALVKSQLLMPDDRAAVWFSHPDMEIPHCTISSASKCLSHSRNSVVLALAADGHAIIINDLVATITIGTGGRAREYTYHPGGRSFKYKTTVECLPVGHISD